MKKLSLRFWLACVFIFMLTVVLCATLVMALVLQQATRATQPQNRDAAASRAQAVHLLLAQTEHWTNPAFQRTIGPQLTSMGVLVVIQDHSGKIVYRSASTKIEETGLPFSTIPLVSGGQLQATASLYEYENRSTGATLFPQQMLLFGVMIFLLALIGATWFFSRTLLRPLAALSTAARQVAAHDLDLSLPTSSIREVAEVTDAFETMRDELLTSLSRQAELEQERRLFISAIAHDLRTPLFALRGSLQGFAQGLVSTPEKAARYLQVCQEKAETLERLVEDLFTYAQLEYLELVPKRELFDLGDLLHRIIEGFRPQAETRGINMIEDGPVEPCLLKGDTHLLTRAFGNLVENALRYTPVEGTIVLFWQRQNACIQFSLTDSGSGIASEDLPHLFTPLYRGERSRNRQTGGAGLGLTIARRIMQAHGGDLTARNAVTGGAVFLGSLPAINAEE